MIPPNKTTIEELSKPTESENQRECLLCGKVMVSRRDNFLRHYSRRHLPELLRLGRRYIMVQSSIMTKDQYIDNIIEIMVVCNLPFSFWSHPAVLKNQECYAKEFGITCSAKTMHDLLTKYSQVVRERLKKELCGRLISLKFDLATRKGRNILGIAAQFVDDWYQEIRYLGMKEVTGASTAENLRNIIDGILGIFDLETQNVYSVTTDNGGNVLKTSRMILGDVDWPVSEEELKFIREQIQDFENDDDDDEMMEMPVETVMEFDYGLQDTEESDIIALDIDEERETQAEQAQADLYRALERAVRPYAVRETRCAAHVVQLAVLDFIKLKGRRAFLEQLKVTVKEVRKYIRKLPPTNTKPKQPTLANDTRWGSSYDMVRS